MSIEKDVEIKEEMKEKVKGRSIIYDNIDLEVKTVDKILITLFIIIAIVFCYAIFS